MKIEFEGKTYTIWWQHDRHLPVSQGDQVQERNITHCFIAEMNKEKEMKWEGQASTWHQDVYVKKVGRKISFDRAARAFAYSLFCEKEEAAMSEMEGWDTEDPKNKFSLKFRIFRLTLLTVLYGAYQKQCPRDFKK